MTTRQAYKIAYAAYRATRLNPFGVSSAIPATVNYWDIPKALRDLVSDAAYLAMCHRDSMYRPHLYPGKGPLSMRLKMHKTFKVFFGGFIK